MFNKIRNLFHDDANAAELEQKTPQTNALHVSQMREIPACALSFIAKD